MELDIYLPSLNLAFEYQVFFPSLNNNFPFFCSILILYLLTFQQQERHHYTSAQYTFHTLDNIQKRDETKRQLVQEKGITLITVPCWWNGQQTR